MMDEVSVEPSNDSMNEIGKLKSSKVTQDHDIALPLSGDIIGEGANTNATRGTLIIKKKMFISILLVGVLVIFVAVLGSKVYKSNNSHDSTAAAVTFEEEDCTEDSGGRRLLPNSGTFKPNSFTASVSINNGHTIFGIISELMPHS